MKQQIERWGQCSTGRAKSFDLPARVLQLEPVVLPEVLRSRAWPTARRRRSTGARTARPSWRTSRCVDGRCERCGTPVIKRDLEQWFFKITDYADELLDFDEIEWPERVKTMQRNWIGRSEGAEFDFTVAEPERRASAVFTTRPDTLLGATFMVLAPEHPLVDKLTTPEQRDEVEAYVDAGAPRDARSSALAPTRRRPASSSAPMRSTRSTASASRSGSPTTC